ncbi:MAG TPA: hypothetical protein VN030_00160 [Cellvibrio sp.]|nr:hypothetical protein [Cellvibrio sp.]
MQNDNSVALSSSQSRSSPAAGKKFILLFIACFILPLVAAKLALALSWFHAGVGNQGNWLEREVNIVPATRKHWQLVYIPAGECEASCYLALYILQQTYSGLGRQQEQLNALVLADQVPQQLENFSALHWQPVTMPVAGLQNHIVIVNQLGMALLQYPVVSDQTHMLDTAKRIRADLRRLMTYDRGGY